METIRPLPFDKTRLFFSSFLMLFVELTLIRWTSANVFYLFSFANFILLASFLGIGLGFLRNKSHIRLFHFAPLLLALIIGGCYLFGYEYKALVNPITDNLIYQINFQHNVLPAWVTMPIIFIVVVALMTAIADEVARIFIKFPPLTAYRFEMLGSLTGIAVFSLLAFVSPAPIYWGFIIGSVFLFLFLISKTYKLSYLLQIPALILIAVIFVKETHTPNHLWSTYYKIEAQPYAGARYVINVNGLPQQIVESVEQRRKVKPFYLLPYDYTIAKKSFDNVLVVGAGTGGDVAIALAQGAKHVDAVEIDPALYQLGIKLNPDHPYADARVTVFINDGRAFLQQSTKKYDMIIFALTDSLMMLTGQSSLRLENYLYTVEGIEQVKQHLTATGIFTIYNYYGNWIGERLANTAAQVFQQSPCFKEFGKQDNWATVIVASKTTNTLLCPKRFTLNDNPEVQPITDDHPFLYLQGNQLPSVYLAILFFILIISLCALQLTNNAFVSIKNYSDLFLMGAAFLLLETKSIINFALLFGTTWLVNALVFIGILVIVYFAIELTHRVKINRTLLCVILLLALLLAWMVPNSYLLSLAFFPRLILAIMLSFTPILIANLIFTDRFQRVQYCTQAFGANLIGAVVGGLLEYTSLVVGYRNLFILIICLYVLAMMVRRVSVRYSVVRLSIMDK